MLTLINSMENKNELKPISSGRLYEIDVIKTLAIFFMVIVHCYENFSGIEHLTVMPGDVFRNVIEFIGGPLVAPVFMFTMGMGMIYTRHSKPSDFIKRGVILLIGGFALNFVRQTGPFMISDATGVDPGSVFSTLESFFIVDILHFAGLSFIFTGILKNIKLRPWMIAVLSLVMLGCGVLTSSDIVPCTIPSMLLGFITFTGKTCAFPLLPWYVYPAAGMVLADILKRTDDRSGIYKKILSVSGAVLVIAVSVLALTGYDLRKVYALANEEYYNHNFIHLIVIMSVVLVELSLAFFIFRGAKETALGRFVRYCGTNLNTIYILQWVLISAGVTAVVLFDLGDTGAVGVIPLGLIFAIAAIGLSVLWNKVRKKIKKAPN